MVLENSTQEPDNNRKAYKGMLKNTKASID